MDYINKNYNKMKTKIALRTRLKILNEIFFNFQQITQWLPSHIEHASKYYYKAEVLIEFLETEDCGSVGGFDLANPNHKVTAFQLYDRFLTLMRKYHKACTFDPVTLGVYFIKLSKLRDKQFGK